MTQMTPEVKDALENSIKHWEANVRAEHVKDTSASSDDCALCSLFYDKWCVGCPVALHIGDERCRFMEYREAADARRGWHVAIFRHGTTDSRATTHRTVWRKQAQKMVDFLKRLRN